MFKQTIVSSYNESVFKKGITNASADLPLPILIVFVSRDYQVRRRSNSPSA
jgi:hypothetical protein